VCAIEGVGGFGWVVVAAAVVGWGLERRALHANRCDGIQRATSPHNFHTHTITHQPLLTSLHLPPIATALAHNCTTRALLHSRRAHSECISFTMMSGNISFQSCGEAHECYNSSSCPSALSFGCYGGALTFRHPNLSLPPPCHSLPRSPATHCHPWQQYPLPRSHHSYIKATMQ
jgi:hypothetical protein